MKKIMLFAAIFVLMLLAYIALHGALYVSIVRFLGIVNPARKELLLAVFIVLGLSFFVSALLSHWKDNAFTRGYYFVSGTWLGFGLNLLLFFALAWLIVWFSNFFHVAPREKLLGIIVLWSAIAYSAYGIWNAFTPRVTHLDVSIDNLPKQWVGKKIVQISDVHLGHIYRESWMSKVASQVNSLDPAVVVITGDLFDGTDGNLDSFAGVLKEIKAPGGVYFVTGNHETYLGVDKAYGVIKKTNIVPLRDSLVDLSGLQFVGIDYPLHGKNRDIAKIISAMPGYNPNVPSILLIHEPVQIATAKKLGISLQLSGHTHKGQLFPFGIISWLVYPRYDFGFKRDGSYAEYTSSGLGGWGPPMRTQKISEIVEITLH
ncbi:MAG TPA: metallophosphoesterase [Patescibacteria group bacterium]